MIPKNPRVVITGAGSGLGAALCGLLAERGARIVAADLNLAAATEVAARLGNAVHPVGCNVAKLDAVERLANETERLLGGVDLVVNNAGVAVAGHVGEVPIDDWRWVVDVNMWGVIHGCHVFVPRLRAQGSGHILNVASAAGLVFMPYMAPYNVTKAAVVALSETLFSELASHGVGVTVLCPTFFPTNLTNDPRTSVDPHLREAAARLVKEGSWTAERIARAALAGVEAGKLHVTPQADASWGWRLKRLAPRAFQRMSGKVAKKKLFGG